jgi:hypothetical protein
MTKATPTICGLEVEVRKDWYNGLWNIYYVKSGGTYAGPYRTKKEAVQRLAEFLERDAA